MTQPTIQVLLDDASNGGTFPYDVTSFVRLPDSVTVQRGRGDEFADIQASILSLTLENTDGRFTLGSTVGGYGGALNTDRRIRYKITANGVTTTRFTGYVQNWPAEWPDGGDTFAVAQITATDLFARLSRKTLRSIIEEEILLDAPVAYYTLGEPVGATAAGDTSGNVAGSVTGSAALVTFGSATGPGTDGLTAATFGVPSQGWGNASFPGFAGAVTAECFVNTTSTYAPGGFTYSAISVVWTAGNDVGIAIDNVFNGGKPVAWAAGGGATVIGPAAVNDGRTHHLAVTLTAGGTLTLYVDGVSAGTASAGASDPVRRGLNMGYFPSTLAHVAYYNQALSAARVAAHAAAGLAGFAGERSDQRIARLASYAGITATALETGIDTSVPFVDITGASPLAAIQDVDKAEGGAAFIRGDGTLVMQNRSHRALQTTPDLTMTNNEVDPASRVAGDMQLVENIVTASAGASGATQTAVNASSRTAHGDYPVDLTGLLVSTDELALNAAQWRVGKYAEPFLRMPDLEFDLATLTVAQQASVMALEISDRIQITGMPAQAGSTTLDLLVEGWTETLTADSWTWQANTSNWSTATAWVLGDATYGVLGSTTVLGY